MAWTSQVAKSDRGLAPTRPCGQHAIVGAWNGRKVSGRYKIAPRQEAVDQDRSPNGHALAGEGGVVGELREIEPPFGDHLIFPTRMGRQPLTPLKVRRASWGRHVIMKARYVRRRLGPHGVAVGPRTNRDDHLR